MANKIKGVKTILKVLSQNFGFVIKQGYICIINQSKSNTMYYTSPNQAQQIEFIIKKQPDAVVEKFENLTFVYTEITVKGENFPCVTAFRGGSKKAFLNVFYRNFTNLSKAILEIKENTIKSIEQNYLDEIERKAKFDLVCDQIAVNDIYYDSWGYEQTNIDFYQVVGRPSKCWTVLQKIGAKTIEGSEDHDSDRRVANPDHKIGKPFRAKISKYGSLVINSNHTASTWNGNPVYCSWGY